MHISVNRVFNNVSRNLGLEEYSSHVDSWAEWAFEAEQYIGSLDTFVEKEIIYSSTPAAATATIEWDSVPADKSWIEIGGTRFYFRKTGDASYISDDDYIVGIAGSGATINIEDGSTGPVLYTDVLSTTMANLARKINNSYYNNLRGLTASVTATAAASSGEITLTYSRSGDRGNHVELMTSSGGKVTQFFSGGKEKYHNQQIVLPDNLVNVISARVGDVIIFPTSSQFKSKVGNAHRYYINGNRMNFSNDGYSEDIVVSYLAVELSDEGYPMVKQGHEEAVASYIMWKHKSIGYYAGEVPQYIIKDLEKRWYWLCSKVRGDDNMPNAGELLKIGKVWASKTRPRLYDGLNRY